MLFFLVAFAASTFSSLSAAMAVGITTTMRVNDAPATETTSIGLGAATSITLPLASTFSQVSSPPLIPAICNISEPLCPACDRKNITDPEGTTFEVFCDYVMISTTQDEVMGAMSVQICMEACEEVADCGSINFFSDGRCALALGEQEGLISSPGSTNLLPIAIKSSGSSVSPSTTASLRTSTPLTSAISRGPTSSAMPTATGTSSCDLTEDEICPACNGQDVTDHNGTRYRVFCDNDLYSEGSYSVQRRLTPLGCLAQCDTFSWCQGATYYSGGNCEFARGNDVFPTANAGYAAFLPLPLRAFASGPTSTKISAYPTSNPFTRNWNSSTAAAPTSPSTAIPTAPGLPCTTASITCPGCNGTLIDDILDQTYQVICNQPVTCETTIRQPVNTTLERCLEHCDQDATCFGTTWTFENQTCNLCQESFDFGPTQISRHAFLLAVHGDAAHPSSSPSVLPTASMPASTAVPTPTAASSSLNGYYANVTSSLGSSIAPSAGSSAFTSQTPSTAPTPSRPGFPAEMTAISCPLYDTDVVQDPSDGGYLEILCNAGFTAASSTYTSASDFAACAAYCTPGCDGVQFSSTSCGLYSSISVVGPSPGWTAGASITFPKISSTRALAASGRAPVVTTMALATTTTSSGVDWAALETDTAVTSWDLYTNTVVSSTGASAAETTGGAA